MFNPDREFARLIIDCLGKEGKSISALSKELEDRGVKQHRLIITGYLRAMTDLGILREREIPPSKIYQPVKPVQETIYDAVTKSCRNISADADELILYVLNRLFKRPIFESELRSCGINRPIGKEASDHDTNESRKVLKRAGNIGIGQKAFFPEREYSEKYFEVLSDMAVETRGCRHLVMETRQTKLI